MPEEIIYSIPCDHTGRIFQVYSPDGSGYNCYEFRIIELGKEVIHDSKNRMYRSASLALRDVLNIGLDWDQDVGRAGHIPVNKAAEINDDPRT